jgi:hypothetical protein
MTIDTRILALVRLLAGVCALLFLNSCIEGEEEIWIEKDRSGKAQIRITMPTLLFKRLPNWETLSEDADCCAKKTRGVKLKRFSVDSTPARTVVSGKISFDDARRIEPFLSSLFQEQGLQTSSGEDLSRNVIVSTHFPNLHFHRNIGLRNFAKKQKIPPFALGLLGEQSRFYSVMHLPTAVKTHNADIISGDRRTLEWEFPVADLLQKKVTMTFVAPLPYLFSSFLALAALLLSLFGTIIWRTRRRKKSIPTSTDASS